MNKFFLDSISNENEMMEKLQSLYKLFPDIDIKAMGFPNGWEMEPLWNIKHNEFSKLHYPPLPDNDIIPYSKSLKAYRDAYAIAETERSIGKEEGIRIGEARGRRAEKLSSARKMKEAGLRIDMISDFTGLTEAEIQTL